MIYSDWEKMQKKCNAQIILLEEKDDKKLLEVVELIPATIDTQWMEGRIVSYHVFDGDKWVLATSNYKTAYDIFKSRCQ